MTEALLNKYLQGSCNEEEILEVEQWLHNSETGDLDEILLQIWNGTYPAMPGEQQRSLWSRLRAATAGESPVVPMYPEKPAAGLNRLLSFKQGLRRKALVAASILVLLTAGLMWAHRKPETVMQATIATKEKSSKERSRAVAWVSIINTGAGDKKTELEDGTEVVLGRGSVLRYIKDFEKDRRSIYLEGKGLFKVAKDQQRPFSVYSGDIATTALGTVFRVAADSSSRNISVHLYQGRVVVHSWRSSSTAWADIFLSPGEELLYDSRKMTASVTHSSEQQGAWAGRGQKADNGELRFSNAPLSEVFETLMMHYHQKIDYRKADIIHMDFTGSLSGKDSLSIILTAIANMNKLGMVQHDDIFVIRKSPR